MIIFTYSKMNPLKEIKVRQILSSDKNIELAFLFGSEAAGKAKAISDVDIAVLLRHFPDSDERVNFKLKIADKLGDATGREVDIVVLNNAGSVLKYQVASKGKLLFERKKGEAKKFRILSIKEYFDYLPTFNFHYERLKEKAYG